jgi:hypothetical protein
LPYADEFDLAVALAQEFFDSMRVAPQIGNDMTIGVHGQPDLREPEYVHDDAGRNALDEQKCRT